MSLTPIFDAVLADSEPDLFLAGLVFPRPVTDSFEAALIRAGHPRFAVGGLIPKADNIDWARIPQPPITQHFGEYPHPWSLPDGKFDFLTGAFVPNQAA